MTDDQPRERRRVRNAKRNERARIKRLMEKGDAVAATVAVVRFYVGSGDVVGALARLASLELEIASLRGALEDSARGRMAFLPSHGVVSLAQVTAMAGVRKQYAYRAFTLGALGPQVGTGRYRAILVHVSTAAPWILACRASKGL